MIIDGKEIAGEILSDLSLEIKDKNLKPSLAIILVGSSPASLAYIARKKKAAEQIGIRVELHQLEESVESKRVEDLIEKLNKDPQISGLIIQLPLPKHLNEKFLTGLVSRRKDVDGLVGGSLFGGATPKAVLEILKRAKVNLDGAYAVVVGRSSLVGKPTALLLLQENATVTICHSHTKNLKEITSQADILVAALGKPAFVTAEMVKEGAVVIDVGINRDSSGGLVGDVDFEKVKDKASVITPVPGGVGPLTVAMLLVNLVKASS